MCPGCNSPDAIELGFLGCLKWFRCRDCGILYNRQVKTSSRRRRKQPWERERAGKAAR
jgi:transposase-like protein